ncbi:Replication protein O [Priestia megaterium]|uniref:Replication protein O n=1 Tax=Priestia megaterium TaxID=1404 RepID=UPI002FFFE00F
MQGWIKLHRQIQDHWLYKEKRIFSKYEAWIDLLMMASHKDTKFIHGNELIELEKGSFVTSEIKLMERWKWGKSKLRSFLGILEKDGMIIKKSDCKKTIITICKYWFYHDSETANRPQTDYEQTTERPLVDTIKNVENEKNDREDINTSCRKTKTYDDESVPFQLSLRLLHNIRKNNETFREPDLQKWSNDIRLMMERDNRTEDQIRYLIDWCQQDSFWKANILSPSKLRKQYDQLVSKVKSEKQRKRNSLHDIPKKRPEHWSERKPLTKEELSRIEELEAEMPF